MPRRKITNAERHAFHVERGILEAQLKVKEKTHKIEFNNLLLSAREHVGKLINTMTFEDVVDMVAAIGLTTIIHNAVINVDSLTKILTKISSEAFFVDVSRFFGNVNIVSGLGALIGGMLGDLFLQFTKPPPETPPIEKPKIEEDQYFIVLSWLLSFSIAWCIIKWGDKLINAGITSVPSIIKLLMAV